MLLKLASLGVLVASLYSIVNCGTKDVCNVGYGGCTQVVCWETYVGQEFYKLVVLNLLIQIVKTFCVETLRRYHHSTHTNTSHQELHELN